MKLQTKVIWLICFSITLSILDVAFAQTEKKDNVYIYGDKKKYYHIEKYWDLIGHPMIRHGDDTLAGDSIKYYSEDKKGISVGNVKLFDHENTIEVFGTYGEYFLDEKYARLETDTKLVAIKDHIVVYSKIMERFGFEKIYVAKQDVRIEWVEENATAHSNKGVYDIEKRIITLTEDPYILQDDKRYSAQKIIIYPDTRTIILEGDAEVLSGNQKAKANKIEYFSDDPDKKAVLTGNPSLIEYSAKNSLLGGRPYREVKAKEITFFNAGDGTALLNGDPTFTEFYIEESQSKGDFVNLNIYKREGKAEVIKYFGGSNERYALEGKAQMSDQNRAIFSDRMELFAAGRDIALFRDNVIIYEFFQANESRNPAKIKRKGTANLAKYYDKTKTIILKGNAFATDGETDIEGDIIQYTEGNIEEGYASGKAKMVRDKDWAKADVIKYFNKEEKVVLSGNALYQSEDFTAQADYIEHNDKEKESVLKGKAYVFDKEKEGKGDEIVYSKKNGIEKAKLTGNPSLSKKDQQAFGNIIEYTKDSKKEMLLLDGNARLKEPDQSSAASQIVYYTIKVPGQEKDDEKMLLKNNVTLTDSEKIVRGDNAEYYIAHKKDNKTETGVITGNCIVEKLNSSQKAFSDKMDYSKNNNNEEIITMTGNTHFRDEKKTGYSNQINYYPDGGGKGTDKILMEGNCRVEDPDGYTIGDRMEIYDGNYNQVKVFDNAKYVNEKENQEVTGGYLLYDEDDNVVRAFKDPVFIDKEEEVTIWANRLESYRDKNLSFATGDVKINQDDKNIYGERAKYEELDDQEMITVTGNATMVQDKNVTRAEKIILFTEDRRVEMYNIKRGQMNTSDPEEE